MTGRVDAELVSDVLRGDTDAFGPLVERHQETLFRRAMAFVRDEEAASDLVQTAMIHAYTRLGRCREPHRFGAWVGRILRNLCLDHLRDPRTRSEWLDDVAAAAVPAPDRLSPDRAAADGEARRAIERALELLPPLLREAFLLKHVEELSYEEMVEVTGASLSALKMRVKRAREYLQEALTEHAPGGCDPSSEQPVRRAEQGGLPTANWNAMNKISAALVAIVVSATALSAQAPEQRIEEARARVLAAGIPVEMLELKIAEGRAKGVPMERLAEAIARRAEALERARNVLSATRAERVTTSEVGVAADALEGGISEAVLARIAETAPHDRRAVAIAALTELVQDGRAPEEALARVEAALARGPEALSNLPAQARAAREGQAGPPAAVPTAGKPSGAGRPEGVGQPVQRPDRGGKP
jgi:RNA polymerase sigma-70 factor, ECF subfamily